MFSRFEFALKRSGCLKPLEYAEADWDGYANSLRDTCRFVEGAGFTEAVAFLLKSPPQRQVVSLCDIGWKDTEKGDGEHHEHYVLRLVRVVRNNLFHGGKFPVPVGPLQDVGRNGELIEACLVVLTQCLQLSPVVRNVFDETA